MTGPVEHAQLGAVERGGELTSGTERGESIARSHHDHHTDRAERVAFCEPGTNIVAEDRRHRLPVHRRLQPVVARGDETEIVETWPRAEGGGDGEPSDVAVGDAPEDAAQPRVRQGGIDAVLAPHRTHRGTNGRPDEDDTSDAGDDVGRCRGEEVRHHHAPHRVADEHGTVEVLGHQELGQVVGIGRDRRTGGTRAGGAMASEIERHQPTPVGDHPLSPPDPCIEGDPVQQHDRSPAPPFEPVQHATVGRRQFAIDDLARQRVGNRDVDRGPNEGAFEEPPDGQGRRERDPSHRCVRVTRAGRGANPHTIS